MKVENCMAYEYHKEIVNVGETKDFYKQKNFIGYILSDGRIYQSHDHNIETISSFFSMTIENLRDNFDKRGEILDIETQDSIGQMLINYFRRVSYEEVVALDKFIKKNCLSLSDILVGYFNCHSITRLNKTIITSFNDFRPFHNYILMGFTIKKVDKILYCNGEFKFVNDEMIKNERYLDEMEKLKIDVPSDEDRKLFFK